MLFCIIKEEKAIREKMHLKITKISIYYLLNHFLHELYKMIYIDVSVL